MFARFDENPAMTLQDIKKNKTLRTDGRTHSWTHTRTHGQRENSIPHHKQSLRGYKYNIFFESHNLTLLDMYNGLSQVYYIKLEERIH